MKEFYCLTCPAGCFLSVVEYGGGDDVEVSGNGCERGEIFAKTEISDPMRSLTTTVRTTFPGVPVLPVRTDGEIPKTKIMDAVHVLSNVVVGSELNCGDTVLENVAGTGVNVIATSDILTPMRRSIEANQGNNAPFSDVLAMGITNYNTPADTVSENPDEEFHDTGEELEEEDETQEAGGRSHIRR